MRHALPLCVAVSLAAHLLLLTLRAPSEPPRQAAHAASGSPRELQVRLLPSEPNARLGIAAKADEGSVTPASSMAAKSSSPPRLEPDSRSAPPPEPSSSEPTAQASASEPEAEFESNSPMIAAPTVAAMDEDYVPRSLLSVPPVAQAPVIIDAPEDETDIGRHVGILSLFIDEEGRVRHIASNEPVLPPAFEQAAREAFMAARFSPGQLDGRSVKSRVRVEVVFETTRLLPAQGPK